MDIRRFAQSSSTLLSERIDQLVREDSRRKHELAQLGLPWPRPSTPRKAGRPSRAQRYETVVYQHVLGGGVGFTAEMAELIISVSSYRRNPFLNYFGITFVFEGIFFKTFLLRRHGHGRPLAFKCCRK